MTDDRVLCPSCRRVLCVCPEPLSTLTAVLGGIAALSYVMVCALAALAAGGWLS